MENLKSSKGVIGIILVIIVIVGIVYFVNSNKEGFNVPDYGNYPSRLEPGDFKSWSNVFYNADERENTKYVPNPKIITNDINYNTPLAYNVHSGQTLSVAKTDGISQVGCGIDLNKEPIPTKLFENNGHSMDCNRYSSQVQCDKPTNREIGFDDVLKVQEKTQPLGSIPLLSLIPSVEPVVQEQEQNQVQNQQQDQSKIEKPKQYNLYILFLLLLLIMVGLFL